VYTPGDPSVVADRKILANMCETGSYTTGSEMTQYGDNAAASRQFVPGTSYGQMTCRNQGNADFSWTRLWFP